MWICTPFGILMPALRPAHTLEEGDKRTLQVRARERAYLDVFRERYCPGLGDSIHFPTQDYQWKAYISPQELADAVALLMLDIDYMKFKPESEHERWGLTAKLRGRLHSCYSRMWGDQLDYGDGTSVYQKSWTGKPNPALCLTQGHWYKTRPYLVCSDCKHARTVAERDAAQGKASSKAQGGLSWAGYADTPKGWSYVPPSQDYGYIPLDDADSAAGAEAEADAEYSDWSAGAPASFGPQLHSLTDDQFTAWERQAQDEGAVPRKRGRRARRRNRRQKSSQAV